MPLNLREFSEDFNFTGLVDLLWCLQVNICDKDFFLSEQFSVILSFDKFLDFYNWDICHTYYLVPQGLPYSRIHIQTLQHFFWSYHFLYFVYHLHGLLIIIGMFFMNYIFFLNNILFFNLQLFFNDESCSIWKLILIKSKSGSLTCDFICWPYF